MAWRTVGPCWNASCAERARAMSSDPTRHKCFVAYHADDVDEVADFIDRFASVFIPRCVGVTIDDDFVDSDDERYIKRRIREECLGDSTVTIVLVGPCTWARKFVDWEISSSLRNDSVNKRNGLLAMPLPSMNNSARLPDRVRDNWVSGRPAESYARYVAYPSSADDARSKIEGAFRDRIAKADLVRNRRALKRRNSRC